MRRVLAALAAIALVLAGMGVAYALTSSERQALEEIRAEAATIRQAINAVWNGKPEKAVIIAASDRILTLADGLLDAQQPPTTSPPPTTPPPTTPPPTTPPPTTPPPPPPPGSAVTIVAAGDLCFKSGPKSCDRSGELIEQRGADLALVLGDAQYPSGTIEQFTGAFDASSWGVAERAGKVRPVPGNHEYQDLANGYRAYFGVADPLWSTFVHGGVRFIGLDTEVAAEPGSAQYLWVEQVLAENASECIVTFGHQPRYTSSAKHGPWIAGSQIISLIAAAGGDLYVAAHNHHYERFAPIEGQRQIVAGTGSTGTPYAFNAPTSGSEVQLGGQGVVELSFSAGTYSGAFVRAGNTVADTFSGDC